jgi:glycosyltransferase involved in cell wall biosynthesis
MPMPPDSKKELVSVIVTSYNHAEYLDQRMQSLLKQTYTNIEIIVVDDCSTDQSAAVLEGYKQYPSVKIIVLDKNGGYANACNLGVSLCNGEFIMFAECDDFNEPTHIAVLMNGLSAGENIGVAYCRSNMVDQNGKKSGDDFRFREKSFKTRCLVDTVILKEEMQKYFLIHCVIPNMSAALLRKKYYYLAGGLSSAYQACADWDFWCRVAQCCDFYYVTKPLNNFRTHSTTVRSTFGIKLQVSEMFDLLYRAFIHVQLNYSEQFKFRMNLGFTWANFITYSPVNWIRSFPAIWLKSIQYEKLSILYLFLGLVRKSFYIFRRLLQICSLYCKLLLQLPKQSHTHQ